MPESVDREYQKRWGLFEMTDREQLGPGDSEAQAEARALAFKDQLIEMIETTFPGYWQGVEKRIRMAWLNDAYKKVDKYGFGESINSGTLFIEILVRLGLDFDEDVANKKLVEFMLRDDLSEGVRLTNIVDYIDWTILDRDLDSQGQEISSWGMREILGVMPEPKRVPPKLPTRR